MDMYEKIFLKRTDHIEGKDMPPLKHIVGSFAQWWKAKITVAYKSWSFSFQIYFSNLWTTWIHVIGFCKWKSKVTESKLKRKFPLNPSLGIIIHLVQKVSQNYKTENYTCLTHPRSSGSKFCAKLQTQTEDSYLCFNLLWGCSTTLKLK